VVVAPPPWDHRSIIEGVEQVGPTSAAGAPAGPTAVENGRHRRRRGWWRAPRVPGPLRRSTTERLAGGVAGGLSARFGIDANLIRVCFVLGAVGDGTGFTLYVLAWLFIPRSGAPVSIARRALGDRRTVALALALVTALVGVLLALDALGLSFAVNRLVWPVSIGAGGLVVVWRAADDDEKSFLRELAQQAPIFGPSERKTRRGTVARVAFGVVLVVAGLGGLLVPRHPTIATLETVLAADLVIVGFLVVFGPWWLRLARDLAFERRERVRSEERTAMAATVHDSVLQTLALIQRAAADPREVTRLARAQERELRAWLFEGRAPGSFDSAAVTTVAHAVAVIEEEVEADHRVPVATVAVGDCPLTEELGALLAAGREATVNAAKWSGAPSVSLFVEVEPTRVSLFVRDRGKGFDPASVDGDRRGISESIRARVARYGGTAVIRSDPGSGTEVELVMPRAPSRT
jgi:signal transduction histidine kinase